MEYFPSKYEHVRPNDNEPNDCSPSDPGEEFIGILLNGPEKISLKENDSLILLPICGYYQLEAVNLNDSSPMKLNVLLPDTDIPLSAFVIYSDASPEARDPKEAKLTDEDLEGIVDGSYFNLNVLEFLDFIVLPGRYKIWIEYGKKKSTEVEIMIIATP